MSRAVKNVSASVRQRLYDLNRERQEDFLDVTWRTLLGHPFIGLGFSHFRCHQ